MSQHRRVAVVGAGFMGSLHAAIFARLRGCELAAIVDPNTALARTIAGQVGGCAVYASHEALLESERLDLLSICNPRRPAPGAGARGGQERREPFNREAHYLDAR